jgi:hypothetical protein
MHMCCRMLALTHLQLSMRLGVRLARFDERPEAGVVLESGVWGGAGRGIENGSKTWQQMVNRVISAGFRLAVATLSAAVALLCHPAVLHTNLGTGPVPHSPLCLPSRLDALTRLLMCVSAWRQLR